MYSFSPFFCKLASIVLKRMARAENIGSKLRPDLSLLDRGGNQNAARNEFNH
jgi:hypothetical protein